MFRHYDEPVEAIKELQGHHGWKRWRKEILVELDAQGLGHLLATDLNPRGELGLRHYVSDQSQAVELLTRHMSAPVLQRLVDIGWQMEEATLQATLSLLEVLLAAPERYPPAQSYETHRNLVDLTHATMSVSANCSRDELQQYLKEARSCHDALLARYGHGRASVEHLLTHLVTSSIMEGLGRTRDGAYLHWMYNMDQKIEFPILADLVKVIKSSLPALEDGGGLGEAKKELDDYVAMSSCVSRGDGGRGRVYPDCYRPDYRRAALPLTREYPDGSGFDCEGGRGRQYPDGGAPDYDEDCRREYPDGGAPDHDGDGRREYAYRRVAGEGERVYPDSYRPCYRRRDWEPNYGR